MCRRAVGIDITNLYLSIISYVFECIIVFGHLYILKITKSKFGFVEFESGRAHQKRHHNNPVPIRYGTSCKFAVEESGKSF